MQLQDMHNNVSAFYNDEFEEQKGGSDEAPLRIPNHQLKNRASEMEMQQPIMQIMQMHQQHHQMSSGQKNAAQNAQRYSNLSAGPSNGNQNASCIFSEDSSRMMMISDELTGTPQYGGSHHDPNSLQQRCASRDASRGRA